MKKINLTALNKIYRFFWNIFHTLFIRFSPAPFFKYRVILYNLWGANLDTYSYIYPSTKVWDPRRLTMHLGSCIGPNVEVYNVCDIEIHKNALVSQNTFLCTASHDMESSSFDLIGGSIAIEESAWVCADCFIGPSVVIGKGSACLARSVVVKNINNETVVGGNPAVFLKDRKIKEK